VRPVDKGEPPLDDQARPKKYTRYVNARRDLITRLGPYCSYCEMKIDSNLDVEHIRPKTTYPELELEWDNFLLACRNCNSTKGDKSPAVTDIFWPHADNTYRAFEYGEEGVVKAAHDLPPALKKKAERSISLTGLDKTLDMENASDRRWLARRDAWGRAKEALNWLRECDCEPMRKMIISAAEGGYWSIWMTVFAQDEDMRRRFIHAWRGTAKNCFDEQGGPVPRPNGQL